MKKRDGKNIIIFSLLGLMISWVLVGSLAAQECRVVRILSQTRGTMHVEPDVMWVQAETCVVWNNWSKYSNIQVNFPEGEICKKGTSAATGFTFNEEQQCFITEWIPLGGTSSLTFEGKGEYPYIIKDDQGNKANGKIIVK